MKGTLEKGHVAEQFVQTLGSAGARRCVGAPGQYDDWKIGPGRLSCDPVRLCSQGTDYLLAFVGTTFASVIWYTLYAVYVLDAAATTIRATTRSSTIETFGPRARLIW